MEKIEVLYRDKEILVVNKPFGMSVHNNEDPQNLLYTLELQLDLGKLYPVHRLDKETSGIQLLALNEIAAAKYAAEFQKKTVKKIYIGILKGQLKTKEGLWSKPLTDKAEGRKNPEGKSQERQPCETGFKVINESKYFTMCEFDLKTGRQHQIRKHAAITNHPLVGDPRYGEPNYNQKIAKIYSESRMFLHCAHLILNGHSFEAAPSKAFDKLFLVSE